MTLFLHPAGLAGSAGAWLDLPGVVSPTLPRHGFRRAPRPELDFLDLADEIAGWSEGPMDVVGASFGGMIAMHLALEYPATVRSLVLSCTAARVDVEVHEQRARDTETAGGSGMLRETLERWFEPQTLSDPDSAAVAYAMRSLAAMTTANLAATWRLIASHDVLARLRTIAVPVTLIVGRNDRATPLETMAAIAAELPLVRTVELSAAHMAFLERPQQFSRAVSEHLRWVAGLTAANGDPAADGVAS